MSRRLDGRAALAFGASWALLAASIWIDFGLYSPQAIALLGAAGALLVSAMWLLRQPNEKQGLSAQAAAPIALSVAAVVSVWSADGAYGPTIAPNLFSVAAVLALGTVLSAPLLRIASLAASGFFALSAGVMQIVNVPRSGNDVWWIMQNATGHLFTQNPYSHCLAFDPQPDTRCVFPYPPGIAIIEWPFHALFGDVRYAYLAAAAALALLILWSGGMHAAPWAALAFCYPRFLYELNQAWTEPVLATLLVGVVMAGRRNRRWLAVLLLGVAIASKQHLVFVLPLAAAWPVIGLSGAAIALAIAVSICLPWIVLAPGQFWHDTVVFHYALPARWDSLSIPSFLHQIGGPGLPTLLSLAVTVGVLAVLTRRLAGSEQTILLGGALALFAFDVTSKVAFFNHYLLVLLLLTASLALFGADERQPTRPPPQDLACTTPSHVQVAIP